MSKIRHNHLDNFFVADPRFEGIIQNLVGLFNDCPETSLVRFNEAIYDQLRLQSNLNRSRSSGGNMSSEWRNQQKAQFAGRGGKWVKVEGNTLENLKSRMLELNEEGFDTTNLNDHFESAGFGWVRYHSPLGDELTPMSGFEVRYAGCKVDCPKSLFIIPEAEAISLEKLNSTPFKLGLEGKGDGNIQPDKKALPRAERKEEMVVIKPQKVESNPDEVVQVEEFSFEALCEEFLN